MRLLFLGACSLVILSGAVLASWMAACEIARARERRHARKTAAVRQAALEAGRGLPEDGNAAHETCELSSTEEMVWERYATRYEGLGDDVISKREGL